MQPAVVMPRVEICRSHGWRSSLRSLSSLSSDTASPISAETQETIETEARGNPRPGVLRTYKPTRDGKSRK
jgi:hypothetical protein